MWWRKPLKYFLRKLKNMFQFQISSPNYKQDKYIKIIFLIDVVPHYFLSNWLRDLVYHNIMTQNDSSIWSIISQLVKSIQRKMISQYENSRNFLFYPSHIQTYLYTTQPYNYEFHKIMHGWIHIILLMKILNYSNQIKL